MKRLKYYSVDRINRSQPGGTYATQTPAERLALRRCRKQGLWPCATTPEGDILAMWRGHMYYSPSLMPSRLVRTTIQKAVAYYGWMLGNSTRVAKHPSGDDMTYTAPRLMRELLFALDPF